MHFSSLALATFLFFVGIINIVEVRPIGIHYIDPTSRPT